MMCSRTYLSFSNCFVNFEGFQFVCANHLYITKTKWFTLTELRHYHYLGVYGSTARVKSIVAFKLAKNKYSP